MEREQLALVAVIGAGTMGAGIAPGGAIFTLVETAFAYSCNSHNRQAVAQAISINFASPTWRGEHLTAEAHETMGGQRRLCGVVSAFD